MSLAVFINVNHFLLRITEESGLFNSEPLGIFITDKNSLKDEGEANETWQNLYERELRLAVTHPPANYFQQMILWTDQGKIWKFPIDNEQGKTLLYLNK